jgi:Tn3 transposase DDE domain
LVESNDPEEMEKAIKYTDLIANCIMLQNVIDITNICRDLIQEGHTITAEDLSHMSPYITDTIKRFGEYVIDLLNKPANLSITRDVVIFETQTDLIVEGSCLAH